MHPHLEAICQALDTLGATIVNGWGADQTFCEAFGWNCPAVTRHDAANVATSLASEIRAANIENLDKTAVENLAKLPRLLQITQASTIPNFWGSNNGAAYAAYLGTIDTVRASLYPLLGWRGIPDPKTLPGHTIRKLKSIQAEVDAIAIDRARLERQMQEIEHAHAVAENLPLDLQTLAEARVSVATFAAAAKAAAEGADKDSAAAAGDLRVMKVFAEEASKLVAQCEEAYRATTTKGLAAAFDQRASKLGMTVTTWVGGLIAALVIGSLMGAQRLEALTQALAGPTPNWSAILLHVVLSMLSIGAPIWFAWLATKQIGQRFRLAEDYAFKASVAKAYEGYRREAARIDPQFEARLFSSALTRLEEAPLRLVDPKTHGSPWHEALTSDSVQRTIDSVPELADKALSLARDAKEYLRVRKVPTKTVTSE